MKLIAIKVVWGIHQLGLRESIMQGFGAMELHLTAWGGCGGHASKIVAEAVPRILSFGTPGVTASDPQVENGRGI